MNKNRHALRRCGFRVAALSVASASALGGTCMCRRQRRRDRRFRRHCFILLINPATIVVMSVLLGADPAPRHRHVGSEARPMCRLARESRRRRSPGAPEPAVRRRVAARLKSGASPDADSSCGFRDELSAASRECREGVRGGRRGDRGGVRSGVRFGAGPGRSSRCVAPSSMA
jgi:hypothetical protein